MQRHTWLSLQGVEQLVSSMWPVSRDMQLLVWVHREQCLSLRISKICLCTSSVLLTALLALLTLRGIEVFVVVSLCVPQPGVYQPLPADCSRAEKSHATFFGLEGRFDFIAAPVQTTPKWCIWRCAKSHATLQLDLWIDQTAYQYLSSRAHMNVRIY